MLYWAGCHQAYEAEVLLVGGGHEPQGGQEPQEALPRQCRQAQGGQSAHLEGQPHEIFDVSFFLSTKKLILVLLLEMS